MTLGSAAWVFERASWLGSRLHRRVARALSPPSPFTALTPSEPYADVTIALRRRGVHCLPADAAMPVIDEAVWSAARPVLDGERLFVASPAAFYYGLSAPMLDLAEAYLGEPCLYLGATLKREVADGRLAGTRQWHLDVEDRRMLRVLVYLSPVREGYGPFEYLPVGESETARTRSGYRSGYIDDATMAAISPRDAWTTVEGAIGDRIVFDGTRVFHRAQPPHRGERRSITYVYSSRRPLELRWSARLSAVARAGLAADCGARAAACLPKARPFGRPAR